MPRVQVPVTDLTPAKATLTTALAGANNDLKFTAKHGGSWGNQIQVAYVDPGGASATLSVVVTGFLITVNLGRAASAINTTADQVKAAIETNLDALSLVDVANAGPDTGVGVVTAMAATSLAGGSYGGTLPAFTNGDATNDMYFTGNDGRVILQVVSTDAGSQTVTIKRAPLFRGGMPPSDEVVTVPAGATMELGPFPNSEFKQNSANDVYFDPSVSTTLKFRAYRLTQAT